mmetsp:Transcript_16691/g.20821  ORF Transcript_16691/g.20821 Transcript_16691/m.20821 type:complete len:106 (-) Transcript_16691:101-418(-)
MYESSSEGKFLRLLGGDCVGMSTIPEVVAAHHAGMKVHCLSLITNKVVIEGDEGPKANHEEVLEAVRSRSVKVQCLVKEFVGRCSEFIEGLPDLPPVTLDIEGVE